MSYLKIEHLEIAFQTVKGNFVAVKDINLEIEKGEIISIIGHSGCGKSTILNAIAGMLLPSRGQVLLNEKMIHGPGPDRGMVFQNYSLLPWLTVYQNIFEAVDAALKNKTKAEKNELVEKYLKMVGLWDHREKHPKQLSGGMKQRVAIARAFAIDPEVLLLDEPFGALDALTKSALHIELLKMWNLTKRSKTIILVTHDIEEAIFLSDRIVVMNNGPAATIREIEDVRLPRPRDKRETVNLEEYKIIRDRLLSLLVEKIHVEKSDFYQEELVA
jgi:nitrate ABC transporter ATP-binding subunit